MNKHCKKYLSVNALSNNTIVKCKADIFIYVEGKKMVLNYSSYKRKCHIEMKTKTKMT